MDLDNTLKGEKMNESKFKIGDLVQLSAAGKKVRQNAQFNYDGAWGMVVRYQEHNQFPIVCHWFGTPRKYVGASTATFREYELRRKRK